MIINSSFVTLRKKEMDINIKLSNGQILRGLISSPGDNLKAGVVFVHGLGEHLGRYSTWIKKLAGDGIAFTGVDLPGHGKSDGRRGVIKNYALIHEMIDVLTGEFLKTFPGIPVFLYGHSLGGGIVLEYIVSSSPEINGAVVTSPWIKLSFEPDKARLVLAGVMNSILPSLVQPSGLNVDHISHDKAVVDKYKSDPLVHGSISVSLFHSAVAAGNYALANARDLKIPVLLMHGSEDKITSPDASREFASKSDKVELKIWEGGYHELHNELFSEEVYLYIINWMKNHF
jgi:alpha-beta hydrolase superfamily lysophospholipase